MAIAEPEFTPDDAPAPEGRGILRAALAGDNIVEFLTDEQRSKLAEDALSGLELDRATMDEWLSLRDRARKAASMASEEKTYPWKGAANARWPVIATAAMQFNARAYPAIVPSESPVKVKTYGKDENGMKAARADRVAEWFGFQLPAIGWEEQVDELLFQLPLDGERFRKVWYDPILGLRTKTCDTVYINNNCPELARMPRISEEFSLYPHEIVERIQSERFVEWEYDDDPEDPHRPQDFVEQMCRADLDDDGYGEPYIVTVHKDTEEIVRVQANFRQDDISFTQDGSIARIRPREFYVTYKFLPSIDGTFLGTGLGALLANPTDLINGVLNQMLDAGHLAMLGGGFIGQGVDLRRTKITIRPGYFQNVNATGQDLRQAIVPHNFRGPDAVMFQLLGLLIEGAEKIASVNEAMSGDVAATVQPTTLLALIEQGERVFSAAYKRIYRALRDEFALMCRINAETVHPELYVNFHDMEADPREDFALTNMDIAPVADPGAVTNTMRMAKAQLLREMALEGQIDPGVAARRVLHAAGVENIDELIPEPDPVQAQMAAAMGQALQELQLRGMAAEVENKEADTEKKRSETVENRAQAMNEMAEVNREAEAGREERALRTLETVARLRETSVRMAESDARRRVARMAGSGRNGVGSR